MTNFLEEVKTELTKAPTTASQSANPAASPVSFNLRDLVLNSMGSFTRGYHLEFAIPDPKVATELCEQLALDEIFAHMSRGRVYLKDSESICNLLAIVGAHKSLLKLNNEIIARSVNNTSNRKTNCDTHNIARQIATASTQIEQIRQNFDALPPELQPTARARIENPTATYDELAKELNISKSALAHRLKRMVNLG